ncbi:MAG: DEAD/DEAH box helicase family protein [Actinomycetota bacterium]
MSIMNLNWTRSQPGWRTPHATPGARAACEYQRQAIEEWWLNDFQGILAMATGTGKTVTALSAIRDLSASERVPLVVLVLAPFKHLVDQWCAEIARWGGRFIACYESTDTWVSAASEGIALTRAGIRDSVFLVATHATSNLPAFRNLIMSAPGESLCVIADEAHRLGAPSLWNALPPNARFRLGLSATPERDEDETGTERLLEYFGGVVFEFGIDEAIAAGALAPYEYFPELVPLDRDELNEYRNIVERLERELAREPDGRSAKLIGQLYLQRATVLNTARGKLKALREAVERQRPDRSLIYCAGRPQLAAVMDLLWAQGITSRQFTGEESRRERTALLEGLVSGATPALVAIRCLDEGVDIPEAMSGYLLASSGNPREFVQRRGRLLRLSVGKTRARIFDYIVVPDGRADHEREVMRREVRRVMTFAQAALNGSRAIEALWPTIERFDLVHELGVP